jgi:hypothetical protein
MKYILTALVVAMSVSACSSTGVIAMDKDTYMIAKKSAQIGIGAPIGAKADVYQEANEFCMHSNKKLETVNLDMIDTMPARPGSATLQFRCI